nr:hypothetical protein [Tanacetum cinerariifolium]
MVTFFAIPTEKQLWTTVKAKNINGEAQIYAKVDGKKVIFSEASISRDRRFGDEGGVNCFLYEVIFEQLTLIGKHKSRKTKRKDTELPQTSVPIEHVANEIVNEEMDESLERATTTATSLDAEQDRVNAASIATSITATSLTISKDEIILAKALIEIKTSRTKAKGIIMQEPSETPTTIPIISFQQPSKVHDKARKTCRKKRRQEEEANNALIETWEDIQAKVDDDYQLVERLQAEEQEQLTNAKKAKLFMEFMEKRRKFFAANGLQKRGTNHVP